MNVKYSQIVFSLMITFHNLKIIYCHARLMEPPSRSSMWRFGYNTPKNYDDDGLYCGGMNTHWKQNGGKCGVCGDPWHMSPPRPHETGGKYGNGIIVRNYKREQIIPAVVDVTANHRGFFEFRLCPHKNLKKEVSQECLDKNLLTILNTTSTKYYVEKHGRSRVQLALQLPKDFLCKRCVFQWTYTAGNNWGRCKNGSYSLGCGAQETFKSCADVSITHQGMNDHQHLTLKPTDLKPLSTKLTTVKLISSTPTIVKPVSSKPTAPGHTQHTNKKKKYPLTRPSPRPITTFQEALERIKNDPKLKWMLQTKRP